MNTTTFLKYKGNITTNPKSVKEKHNLFPHNLWTGGDSGELPNLNRNNYATITYNPTTEYHTNGNHGIITTNTKDNQRPYLRFWINDISEWIGNTILYSTDVKTTKPLSLVIYEYDGSTYKSSRVAIPENSDGNFQVTRTISSTAIALWLGIEFQTVQNQGEYFYTDNWKLFIQDE